MKSKTMWKKMGMLGLSTMMALSSFNIPIHANTLQGLSGNSACDGDQKCRAGWNGRSFLHHR